MISYLLKLTIIFLCIIWLYNHLSRYVEKFDNKVQNKQSLYETLTANCKREYCNINNWPALGQQNVKLPDGYMLTRFTTNQGCCIIPKDVNEYIYDSKGDNNYKMNVTDKSILKS